MAKYKMHCFCDECSEVHPIPITVELDDGPPEKESMGNQYAGVELSGNIATSIQNKTECPNTGVMIIKQHTMLKTLR